MKIENDFAIPVPTGVVRYSSLLRSLTAKTVSYMIMVESRLLLWQSLALGVHRVLSSETRFVFQILT